MAIRFLPGLITRVVKPKCPKCRASIAAADINLREGMMLCRACGHVASLRDVVGTAAAEPAAWSPSAEPVPAPPRPKTRVEQVGDTLTLRRRTGHIAITAFMLVWMSGWTAGCIALVHQAIMEPSTQFVAFCVPFVIGWFFGAALLAGSLFGRESLVVSRDGVDCEQRMLVRWRRQRAELDDVRAITEFSTMADSESGQRSYGLRIETTGEPIRFGQGTKEEERAWLKDLIGRHIETIAPGRLGRAAPAAIESATASEVTTASTTSDMSAGATATSASGAAVGMAAAAPAVETLMPNRPPKPEPLDSRLRMTRELNCTTFERTQSLKSALGGIAGMTGICFFWNGIVSVFVMQLIEHFEWFLLLFLIPFEIIGLGLLIGWLVTLTSPFWRRTWTFRPGEVVKRFGILGIGRDRRYELLRLKQLELRRGANKRKGFQSTNEDQTPDRRYALALVNADGSDLATFDGLTEAEARWMADELFVDFRSWFVHVESAGV